mmetsp:Transcript_3490/g.4788  ORF Transcript_3490/g.4788 Transcript_3490/m.4788 type:complete len:82 (-) Transcript_3490:314-559(-)
MLCFVEERMEQSGGCRQEGGVLLQEIVVGNIPDDGGRRRRIMSSKGMWFFHRKNTAKADPLANRMYDLVSVLFLFISKSPG